MNKKKLITPVPARTNDAKGSQKMEMIELNYYNFSLAH